jgi:ribose-phosphate pyrophosphokinase
MTSEMKIFTGNANIPLAQKVADHLQLPLGSIKVGRYSDGEIFVEILENVRGREVFIIQPMCNPVNDSLMELVIMADAFRRASVSKITAICPYYGYARQDRRVRSTRVPISARVVADMLVGAGIDHVLTVDIHADQIQGFFSIPVDNVYSTPIFIDDIKQHYGNTQDIMVISPDVGGVVRARAIAKLLGTDLAILDKRRPKANEAKIMHIIGDVVNKDCILVDDMIDTAGTLRAGVEALKEQGAKRISAYITHPILSGKAIENIELSALDELVVTDTIPLSAEAMTCKKIRQISVGNMLAQCIDRMCQSKSLMSMFS